MLLKLQNSAEAPQSSLTSHGAAGQSASRQQVDYIEDYIKKKEEEEKTNQINKKTC